MAIEEILIVRHDGNLFGINTDVIEHILRVLDITPLPFSAKEVRGFCSIEGSVLTVLDLSKLLLNDKEVDKDLDAARLISVEVDEKPYAILLEEVINNISIDPQNLEYVSKDDKRKDGVVAVYKYEDEIIQVLNMSELISNIQKLTFDKREFSDKYEEIVSEKSSDGRMRRYFLFKMGSEQYAIDVNNIREVITVPETFTEMADTNEEVLGMMTLRDEIVVTIDLRIIYELPAERVSENRIIVVQLDDKVVGLLIDSIIDIADFHNSDIDVMPSNFRDKKIAGIAHHNDELISLVDMEVINTLIQNEARIDATVTKEEKNIQEEDDYIEIVSFTLDKKSYALHTETVIEIIDTFDVTDVSDTPGVVDGITNIRGKVIPVVSLYDKLSLTRRDDLNRKMLVCQYAGKDIGLLVDDIKDVSNIPVSSFVKEEESEYFSEVIKVDDTEVILMVNLDKLLG
jgi:purine-binding chemotaxis protein CheW